VFPKTVERNQPYMRSFYDIYLIAFGLSVILLVVTFLRLMVN